MKELVSIVIFFCCMLGWSQSPVEIRTAVDRDSIKIGEQINLTLQLEADSLPRLIFQEKPSFGTFELLEAYPLDTLVGPNRYVLTQTYALIHFDSGQHKIPAQPIKVNQKIVLSDSVLIDVATVVVDTLKQPLYDIKPIQEAKKSYTGIIQNLLLLALILGLLLGAYFFWKKRQQKKIEEEEELPPFDRALLALKALEEEKPEVQEEYKQYYSRLTDVVRRYLEEETAISALESTTDELLLKLELLKESGTLVLEQQTLTNLKKVLQNADLVKFARSVPEHAVAHSDRKLVEEVVIETQDALPEPTEEELAQTLAYKKELALKRRKEKIRIALYSGLGLGVISLALVIGIYGFTPVKDTLLGYPTKVLLDGDWLKSQYGSPPIALKTPEVLKRDEASTKSLKIYKSGDPTESFEVRLEFDYTPKPSNPEATDEEKEEAIRALMNDAIAALEDTGAKNILVQNDVFTTLDGTDTLRMFGTLDLKENEQDEEYTRCRFVCLLFPFQEVGIRLDMVYPRDDRYGDTIEKEILNSIEVIKEL